MTIVRVKGFNIFTDAHGHKRCYHRRTGTPIDLKQAPLGSAAFLAEAARIGVLAAEQKDTGKPGTLGLLIRDYRASSAWKKLAPRTQADYHRVLEWLKPINDTPLKQFSRPLVVKIRDKAEAGKGLRFANYVKAVLSVLFAWGKERGRIAENYGSGIKDLRRPRGAPEANRTWSDQERQVVLDEAPPALRPALALMAYTGLGPKDALALPRNFVRDGEIATTRSKTGEPVFWPIPEPLAALLDQAPRHLATTLCVHSGGRPWSQGGFSASWVLLRKRLEREGKVGPGLTLYGLRHTLAVILRESGADERTIADALGQKTIEMARHYAKGANLTRKMRGVVKNFDIEMARRKLEQ
jgi:integrase